jgi:predicted metal-dependent hydrolase
MLKELMAGLQGIYVIIEAEDYSGELKWELRVSRRIRYARLQIKPFGGLEVVIPPRFPRHQVPGLVAKHAGWARHQLARQAQLRQSVRLPSHISLAFDNSSTPVIYTADPLQMNLDMFAELSTEKIVIDADSQRERISKLRNWIRRRARESFPALLTELSTRTGLGFNRLSIRSQKTRWGSCSIRGNISLNDQLLFMPAKTVQYLMIHELCHTCHLNHSKAFWTLVESHCADYRSHEQQLSESRNLVPDWFLLDLYA